MSQVKRKPDWIQQAVGASKGFCFYVLYLCFPRLSHNKQHYFRMERSLFGFLMEVHCVL